MRTNPNLKGFYTKILYRVNLRKIVENFDHIMAQMPNEPEGEEAIVNLESPKLDFQLVIDVEEVDQPSSSTWVAKGNKRQKTMHIPKRVVTKALQVIAGNDQYFVDNRKNYLQEREIEVGRASTNLQIAASRLDDRLIQSDKFTEDDDFIKSSEFKSFLYRVKKNELTLSLMPGEDLEKNKELVDKLLAYDPDSETMTLAEARELVHRSVMILVPGWDIERAFVLE